MLFARAIRRRYPECEVEVWRPERTLERSTSWCDNQGVVHRVFPSIYVRFNLEYSRALVRSVRDLPDDKQTYIWMHGIYSLHAYCLAPLLRHRHAIGQSHGGFPTREMFSISRHRWLRYLYLLQGLVEQRALPLYPHLFAISTEEKKHLHHLVRVPASRVSVSPTGVDFDLFSPGPQTIARTICGIHGDTRAVLFVGRFAKEKGIKLLIEAFSKVAHAIDRSELFLVGGGPLQADLEQQVVRLGLGARVHFVGHVSQNQLPNWYRAADVTVIPSPIEWFGKVTVESMACGTTVVATSTGGSLDIVREFESGRLVPPDDSDQLAQAVLEVLSMSMTDRPNIQRARKMFDWSAKLQHAFELFPDI